MEPKTMTKGYRREKQCAELYEQAGYETYRPPNTKFGENDVFGLFDVIAFHPDRLPIFAQVKANQTRGMAVFEEQATDFITNGYVTVQYLVCHDNQGWRLAQYTLAGYSWVVDERELDCNMGEGIVEYLRRDE